MPEFKQYGPGDTRLSRDDMNRRGRTLHELASNRPPKALPRNAVDVRVVGLTDDGESAGTYEGVELEWDDSAGAWVKKPGGLVFDGDPPLGRPHRNELIELRKMPDLKPKTPLADEVTYFAFRFLGDEQNEHWYFEGNETRIGTILSAAGSGGEHTISHPVFENFQAFEVNGRNSIPDNTVVDCHWDHTDDKWYFHYESGDQSFDLADKTLADDDWDYEDQEEDERGVEYQQVADIDVEADTVDESSGNVITGIQVDTDNYSGGGGIDLEITHKPVTGTGDTLSAFERTVEHDAGGNLAIINPTNTPGVAETLKAINSLGVGAEVTTPPLTIPEGTGAPDKVHGTDSSGAWKLYDEMQFTGIGHIDVTTVSPREIEISHTDPQAAVNSVTFKDGNDNDVIIEWDAKGHIVSVKGVAT